MTDWRVPRAEAAPLAVATWAAHRRPRRILLEPANAKCCGANLIVLPIAAAGPTDTDLPLAKGAREVAETISRDEGSCPAACDGWPNIRSPATKCGGFCFWSPPCC